MSKRIVFLDVASLDYGDLNLTPFKRLGKVVIYKESRPSQIRARLRGAEIAITNKCLFTREAFASARNLKLLCVCATGTNNVDLVAARKFGVAVTNVAGYSTESVVQLTFGLMLSLTNQIPAYCQVTPKRWPKSSLFTLPLYPITELCGKTLGIIGYGQIGRRVARVAKALRMRVVVAKLPGRKYPKSESWRVALTSLAKRSDVVSVHAPLTPATKHLINSAFLKRMRKGTFLINMARGDLVEEKALSQALRRKHLGGAAVDVLSQEPPAKDNPLLSAPRLLMTPHVAWASLEARTRLMREVHANIHAFVKGKRRNRVA